MLKPEKSTLSGALFSNLSDANEDRVPTSKYYKKSGGAMRDERGGHPSLTVGLRFYCRVVLTARARAIIVIVVELSGIEPLTSCVQGRRSPS